MKDAVNRGTIYQKNLNDTLSALTFCILKHRKWFDLFINPFNDFIRKMKNIPILCNKLFCLFYTFYETAENKINWCLKFVRKQTKSKERWKEMYVCRNENPYNHVKDQKTVQLVRSAIQVLKIVWPTRWVSPYFGSLIMWLPFLSSLFSCFFLFTQAQPNINFCYNIS